MRYHIARSPALVLTTAALLIGIVGVVLASRPGHNTTEPASAPKPIKAPLSGVGGGLQDLGRPPGVQIGAAAQRSGLEGSRLYRRVLSQEFDSLTAESQLKWDVVEPTRGQLDWTGADALVNFAEANHQGVRGHTLVWHNALPGWLANGNFSPEQLRDLLREHIQTVVSRYRGRIAAWDVVNEPMADAGGQLRPSLWFNALGPGYIADALRWAHEADPAAKLYINEYGVENVNAKSDALYNVVAGLRNAGVPLDGVGVQSHLTLSTKLPTFEANLRRFTDLGLDVAVTEMDVRLQLPAPAAQRTAQADLYADVLRSCLGIRRCVSYTVWGFSDGYSWIPHAFPGWGDACLFDAAFQPKPAYQELRQLLSAPPRR